MTTSLIRNGWLARMDEQRRHGPGDLLIRDDRIVAVGDGVSEALASIAGGKPDETIDASGTFVLPGFVHGHLHLCQTLFRGLAEQSDLLRWLRESIWPLEAAHTEASVAASARLGVLELLAGGVTCVNDMGTVRHTEATASVLAEAGIRAVLGKALMDRGDGVPSGMSEPADRALAEAMALADRWHGKAGGRLHVSLAPRFILSCSDALWRDVAAASQSRGLLIHTHVSESPGEGREVEAAVGSTATRYFERHGILGERFVGAHGVWLDGTDLASFRAANAALVHCPGSNLKLGSGLARVRSWLDAGVRSGLGSDGAACNNRLDTFAEMSLAAGVSRVADPAHPLTAREVVELATIRGAEALGLSDAIGSLEPGKQADLILLDAAAPHLAPHATRDPYPTIVHAMRDSDVRLTMVAGRVLYRDGRWSTLDPRRVASDARSEAQGLVGRAGLS